MTPLHERGPLQSFFATGADAARLFQRVVLGAVFFPHGAQKMLGLFGGHGFAATMGAFTGKMHLPAPVAFLVICGEFFGSIGLVLGLATRLCAAGITLIMIGAVVTTHLPNGFFMNWSGTQRGEGFEYHLLALGLAVPLVVWGGGLLSVDRWIAGLSARRTTPASPLRPSDATAREATPSAFPPAARPTTPR